MNYLSKPADVQNPIEMGGSLQLAIGVANTLQSRYDANKSLIDQTLAQYESLRGLTETDNAYIAAQVSNVKNQVNQLGSLNLAHSTGRDSVLNNMKNVLKDPIVQDILVSKANYDNYNAEVSKIKEKKPENYNDANYQYGLVMGGYKDYLEGKTKKLGSMQYTPYKDLTEEHLKKIKTIKDLKGKRFIETRDNQGGIQKKEIDGLTNQEIQEYFGSIMTSEELQQMKINGWARFGQNETQTRGYFKDYNTKLQGAYNSELKLAQAKQKNTSLPQNEREGAEREIEAIKSKINQAKINVDNADKYNIADVSLQLEKADYLSGLSNIASAEWSAEYKKDEIFFAQEDLKIKYEDLALKRAKEERETAEFGLKMRKEYGVGADGQPTTEEQVSVTSRRDVLPEDIDGLQTLQQQSDEQFKIVTDTTRELISKLKPEQRGHFVAELEKRGVDANLNKTGTGRVVITDAIQEAFDASNLGVYKKYADAISTASAKKDSIAKDIITVERDSYYKKFREDPSEYVDSFKTAYERARSDFYNTSQTPERRQQTKKTFQNLEQFAKNNGGWDNMEKNLIRNPLKVREFAKVFDDSRFGMRGRLSSLSRDSKESVENTLKEYSNSGKVATFSVYDNINFLNADTRKRIIDRIPQDRLAEGGHNFDPKGALTARKVGDKIELLQYKGSKDGVPVYAKASYDKGDFGLYDEVAKYIDYEEGQRSNIGVNENTTFKKRSSRFDVSGVNEIKEAQYVNAVSESINGNPNILPSFKNGIGDPRFFSTPRVIKNNLKEGLKAEVPQISEQKREEFVNKYTENLNEFSLKIITDSDPTSTDPDDKIFGFEVFNPENKSIGISMLGLKSLDKDTKYLLEYQPQIYTTNFIYSQIKKNPTYIDQVFKK